MNELIEERKRIIESYNWGWGDVKNKTRSKSLWLRFFYALTSVFFIGLLLLANYLILNTFLAFTDRFVWKDAPFLVAMMISFLINSYRYHLEQSMFFHYHQLGAKNIQLTKEKNEALRKLLKDTSKPRTIITFVLGLLILFAGIICYFTENDTWWGYVLIPFLVFEALYSYDLHRYYQDFKKAV